MVTSEPAASSILDSARLAAVIAASADAIVAIDTLGIISLWNPAAEKLTGIPAITMIGAPASQLVPAERPLPPDLGERVRAGGTVREIELAIVRSDGGLLDVAVSLAPILDTEDVFQGYVAVLRDVSERRAIERLRLRVFSLLAHELKTPITTIKGAASGLRLPGLVVDLAERDELLELVVRESDRLTNLVDDLLDAARIESGAFTLEREAWSFGELVAEARAELLALAGDLPLTIEVDADLPEIWADFEQIRRVLTNLVGNAAKYSPPSGTIVVRAERAAAEARISVSDQGAGIPPEDQERIFEPFFRSEGRGRPPGSGLGLALCQGIVEAHGCRLTLESSGPTGSTFAFTLPFAESGS